MMIAGNLGTHNVHDILELWLADDHWRDFVYRPANAVGPPLRVELLPGEFDYFLSVIDWSPTFIDDNIADQELKAEAFARIDSRPSDRRRPIDEVRAAIGPPLSESMQALPLPKELGQVIRHEAKRDEYRAGKSQTAVARAGRTQVKVDVWERSDITALAEKLLSDLEARGPIYDEVIGRLIERETWKGLVARRDEYIRRLSVDLTQREVAKRVGVDTATISRVLQNANSNGHKSRA
jgi:hypothetical protein